MPRKPCPGGSLTSEACWSLRPSLFRLREDGAGQWMPGVEFETGNERKHFLLREAGSQKLFGQLGLAVGERSGFVENGSAAGGNLFEGDGILNNNGTPRGQGDGTNDGDWEWR